MLLPRTNDCLPLPHPLDCIRACVWLLIEGGYYSGSGFYSNKYGTYKIILQQILYIWCYSIRHLCHYNYLVWGLILQWFNLQCKYRITGLILCMTNWVNQYQISHNRKVYNLFPYLYLTQLFEGGVFFSIETPQQIQSYPAGSMKCCKINYIILLYCILPKISPLPSLTSKFLHRYFTLFISPCPYAANIAPSTKMNAWQSTRPLLFVV